MAELTGRNVVMGTLFRSSTEKKLFEEVHGSLKKTLLADHGGLNAFQAVLRGIPETTVLGPLGQGYLDGWKTYESFIFEYWTAVNEFLKDVADLLVNTDHDGKVVIKNADDRTVWHIDNLVRKVNLDVANLITMLSQILDVLRNQLDASKARKELHQQLSEHIKPVEHLLKKRHKELSSLRRDYSVSWSTVTRGISHA